MIFHRLGSLNVFHRLCFVVVEFQENESWSCMGSLIYCKEFIGQLFFYTTTMALEIKLQEYERINKGLADDNIRLRAIIEKLTTSLKSSVQRLESVKTVVSQCATIISKSSNTVCNTIIEKPNQNTATNGKDEWKKIDSFTQFGTKLADWIESKDGTKALWNGFPRSLLKNGTSWVVKNEPRTLLGQIANSIRQDGLIPLKSYPAFQSKTFENASVDFVNIARTWSSCSLDWIKPYIGRFPLPLLSKSDTVELWEFFKKKFDADPGYVPRIITYTFPTLYFLLPNQLSRRLIANFQKNPDPNFKYIAIASDGEIRTNTLKETFSPKRVELEGFGQNRYLYYVDGTDTRQLSRFFPKDSISSTLEDKLNKMFYWQMYYESLSDSDVLRQTYAI